MKRMFTSKKWVYMLACLCLSLLTAAVQAQKKSAAKCAGFTAKITNGSVLNLCNGSTITLTADPAISGYTFQWQIQTTSGGPFTSISGATGSTYTVSSLAAYRVYVSTGSCVDTSGITSVIRIVPDGGKITASTTATICPGEPGGLIKGTQVPGADVGIITYTWEQNESNTGWTTISDATAQDFTVGHLFKTTDFRRVSHDNCGNTAYSNVVTLATPPEIIPGAISPMSQTITAGSRPAPIKSVTAATGGTGNFSYQWQSSLFERGTFVDIPGATSATYSPDTLNQTTYFRRTAKDVRCFTTAQSAVAVVMVSNAILNPGSFTLHSSCFFPGYPSAPLITANEPTGGVAPYKVEWQSSVDNVNYTTIPGATGSVYQPAQLTRSTYFRKKVTDAAGTVAYSNAEKITMIETVLTGGTIKAGSNVACLGSSPAEISSTVSPTGYGENLLYQWQYMNASSGGWKDIDGQIRASYIPEPITEKTTFRRLAIDMCGLNKRSTASNEVVIDVKPALIAGDIEPTSQIIRPGGTPVALKSVANPSGGTGSYSVSWQHADLAVGPWDSIPSQTAVSYQPPALTKSAYYRRVVKDNNCLATKYTYVVEVFLNNAPPLNPCHLGGSQCVFPGNRPGVIDGGNMEVTGGVPPYTYTWETKTITAGTWSLITGATGESYQPQTITQTTQYRRKVTDAIGDFAYSDPFTVEYHTAALNPGTIATKSSAIVCTGSTPGLIESISPVSGYGENPKYQWQIMTEGGNWINISGANEETYQPGTLTQRTHFRRAVTDMCGGVTRTAYSNEVIFDLPTTITLKAGLVDGPFITCSGTAPGTIKNVLEACGPSATHYQWEVLQNGTWTAISGATSASYSPAAISADTKYRRKVADDCGNSGYSNTVEILIYPPIEPGVIGTATQTVCTNQKAEKIKLMTGCHYTDGVVTYQWQSSTSTSGPWSDVSGATAAEYQPTGAAGNMYYRLMVKSATCGAVAYTNTVSVLVNTGCRVEGAVAASATNGDLRVYPNPLTGNAINVQGETRGKVSVKLFNAEGRAIPVTVSQSGAGLMNVSLPGTHSKGMYLLTVSDEKSSWTKKVIVQ